MSLNYSVVCRKDKITMKNQVTPFLRFCVNRKLKYVSLQFSIDVEYWDFKEQRLRDDCPNRSHYQLLIDTKLEEYRKKILKLEALEIEVTFDTLFPQQKKRNICTITQYFDIIINKLKELGKLKSASKYYFTLSSLNKFKSMDIEFSEIDLKFLKDYEFYLRKEGQASNSIATKFSCFKAAYNKALEEGIFTNEDSPFKKYKVGRLWTQTRKRAIHKEDVQKLKGFDLSTLTKYPTPYLEFARDIFMFSYLTAGINFKDIATLRYCDLDNGRIYYSRHKTQKNMNTILLPDAMTILNKYMKKDAGAEDYIFPVLYRNIHITEQQQADRIQKVLKQVNRKLKIISKALNLKINLTTYVARHTFATVLKRSGVDIGIISESLGHSDLKTTQIYLDSFENTQIDAAMQNLL